MGELLPPIENVSKQDLSGLQRTLLAAGFRIESVEHNRGNNYTVTARCVGIVL